MKKKIALVTGGYSGEAEISYKSAALVEKNIDKDKFEVYKIDINLQGWFYLSPNGEREIVNKNNFTISQHGQEIAFDTVLMIMHGTPGEDGKLQGYFDMLNIPYTCCDAVTSALTFNKRYTVAVAAFAGIHVARSLHLFKHTPVAVETILSSLQLPLFVKPNNGGSSIGISKVTLAAQLPAAIEKAFREDDQILIEEFISGREFTIGVFKRGGEIIALPVTEIISENEFFDFEAKYQGKNKEITPAEVDASVVEKISAAAKKIYEVFNCKGVVRIDFIYHEKDGAPYMLEINTVPGQSEASLIPQQVRAMNWTLQDFYTTIIEEV